MFAPPFADKRQPPAVPIDGTVGAIADMIGQSGMSAFPKSAPRAVAQARLDDARTLQPKRRKTGPAKEGVR